MKHALLIGVEDDHPEQRFRPGPSLAAMQGLLRDLGGWTITRVEAASAQRAGILAALAQLEARIEPDDSCLFYFAGHGGIVEIGDANPPLGGRPVFYITAARPTPAWSFEAVLDIELSLGLARIDRICGNVSAILDCCYSARLVRGPIWPLSASPAWLRDLASQLGDAPLDPISRPPSHPRILRLAASSSLRRTFPTTQADGHLGRLTQLFVEVVREAALRVDRLTWDAVVHRVREQAIWLLGCEDQWVSLAGPRRRLVFSDREAPLPRTIGFVPREGGRGGFIRAGALQGVQIGDEWGLAGLTLNDDLQPRWQGRLRVVATDLNRALLEPVGDDVAAKPGTSAHLLGVRQRTPVRVIGPATLAAAVRNSPWLVVANGETGAAVDVLCVHHETLETRSANDEFTRSCFADDARGLAAAVEQLEDWARARLLLGVARSRAPSDAGPIVVSWGRHAPEVGRNTCCDLTDMKMPRAHVGDRLYVRISRTSEPGEWFVSAFMIDVAGRPKLLDASEPDGRELLSGETMQIGWQPHQPGQSLELSWPKGARGERAHPMAIVILASQRPIMVGHLVPGGHDHQLPSDQPRPRRARTRGHLSQPRPRTGPELARAWAATLIRCELDPRPRAPAGGAA
ncbi:hypothetical protein DB30_01265 [Enhygromyxa salina]|uniref:Caspase domain protein n=1 Tax=Enhygromyxa salina TaxID=215803 RepID=A0A0C2CSD1_9BACT|nr:caspase family protein [Enhygromyxa salina]KIG12555.1 hypothetical protein DB30_01265 [Enhygromyxa salina]